MFRRSFTAMCAAAPSVLFNKVNAAECITLNREKALNSLNGDMVELMLPKIKQLHEQPKDSTFVLMKGAGSKAFCAGGDIVCLVKDEPKGVRQQFFYREYQLNHLILTNPHPQVSIWDGIVMGGGVGVSVHGSHRVASEKATFAMPETGIGLFPDVGGSWFLPRLPLKGLGMYLALTGQRLKGADLVHAGIATNYVPQANLAALETELLAQTSGSSQTINDVIGKHQVAKSDAAMPAFTLEKQLPAIAEHFGGPQATTVENIVGSLNNVSESSSDKDWAKKTVSTIGKMSPSSFKISCELNIRGGKLTDPKDMFTLEYNTTQRCMATKDFSSGVTALLIEKTGKPVWDPSTLEGVTQDLVDAHFAPSPVPWHPTEPFPASKL